jgi:hypothetical protein
MIAGIANIEDPITRLPDFGNYKFSSVVQQHLQLLCMAPPEYQPELGTHQAQERRAVRTLEQLSWTTARRAPLEVWLPGNLLEERWWLPGGLTGNQSASDLRCAPYAFAAPGRGWIAVRCGSA